MIEISMNDQVGQLVVKFPQIRQSLEGLKIDYCCGGKLSLREATEKLGLPAKEVLRDLQQAINDNAGKHQYRDWSTASLTSLADYIRETHHSFMKKQLPRLESLLDKTLTAHKEKHGRILSSLSETFAGLKSEIELHLDKEEQVLFPFICELDSFRENHENKPDLHCGSVETPIDQLEHEHDQVGNALDKMREMTSGYQLPDDACETFRALYDGLQELEVDLHKHIHLENNILFPKAIELEKRI